MKLIDKILWRGRLLFFESWGKNPRMLFYLLLPSSLTSFLNWEDKINNEIISILSKNNILKHNQQEKYLESNSFNFKFFYENFPPLGDFISIIEPEIIGSKIIRDNLINYCYQDGPYERDGVRLQRGDVVIDAGANYGLFSIIASKKIGETGKVFAFEPILKTREVLFKNIDINARKNIRAFPFSLGNTNGDRKFFLKKGNLGLSSGVFKLDGIIERVKERTIDNLVKKNKIERIDFIKADIEGMERNMLIGAEKTIKKFKPKLSICIYHLPNDPEVLEKIVKEFVPEYNIFKTKSKLYAWI